jgi:hypothetical protein
MEHLLVRQVLEPALVRPRFDQQVAVVVREAVQGDDAERPAQGDEVAAVVGFA